MKRIRKNMKNRKTARRQLAVFVLLLTLCFTAFTVLRGSISVLSDPFIARAEEGQENGESQETGGETGGNEGGGETGGNEGGGAPGGNEGGGETGGNEGGETGGNEGGGASGGNEGSGETGGNEGGQKTGGETGGNEGGQQISGDSGTEDGKKNGGESGNEGNQKKGGESGAEDGKKNVGESGGEDNDNNEEDDDDKEPSVDGEEETPEGKAAILDAEGNKIEEQTFTNDEPSEDESQPAVNAIQKAVDAALQTIDANTTSLTIQVEAGDYNGNLTIKLPEPAAESTPENPQPANNTSNFTPNENFVLNIISANATKDDDGNYQATADDSVRVNGNILIEGINLLLAGIYQEMTKHIEIKDASLTVIGTTANDTVNIQAGEGAGDITVNTGEGADTVTLSAGENLGSGEADAAPAAITVDTGAGDDQVNVDIGLADGYEKVNVTDEDSAHVHFTGELTNDASVPSIEAKDDELTFVNTENNAISVNLAGILNRRISDELENKAEIEINADQMTRVEDNGRRIVIFESDEMFTNFVLKDSLKDIDTFILKAPQGGVLNQLVIEGEDGEVTINDILAERVNLILRGEEINILGLVVVDNLQATASAGTVTADDEAEGKLGKIESAYESMKADLFNVYHAVEINVGENAKIYASGDVNMKAAIDQSGGMMNSLINALDTLNANIGDTLNMVNVKIGSATINVKGGIEAGSNGTYIYNNEETHTYTWQEAKENPEEEAAHSGSIHLSTDVNTEIDAASGNGYLSSLAIAVAVLNSEINISGAVLKAAEEITAEAKGTVKVKAGATAADLPVSLGVIAVVSDVHTDVTDSELEAGSNVTLTAEGSVEAENKATKDTGDDEEDEKADDADANPSNDDDDDDDNEKSKSGGFFAVSVVNQDVRTHVKGTTIRAGGDVTIHSTANAEVQTKAVSADSDGGNDEDGDEEEDGGDDDDDGDAPHSLGSVKDVVQQLIKGSIAQVARQLAEKAINKINLSEIADKLLAGLKSADHTVEAAPSNDGEKGQVSLSRASANIEDEVAVTVKPRDGYELESITLRYLEPGKASYTTKTLDLTSSKVHPDVGDTYYFDMLGYDTDVLVTYKKKEKADTEEAEVTGDDLANLFKEEDGKKDSDLPDVGSIFDQATGGTKESATADGILVEDSKKSSAITLAFGGNNEATGSLVAAYGVTKAAPGEKVQIIVNPAAEHHMKKGTLTMTYKDASGSGSMVLEEADGKYVATIPAGATEVKFVCEWEKKEEEEEPVNAAAQVTGALGVAVVLNDNEAVIDGSTIVADGILDTAANASTVAVTTADGSGQEADEETPGNTPASGQTETEAEPEGETEYQNGGKIGVAVAVNVVRGNNNAIIKGESNITAGEGLSLTAETEKADSTAKAVAGYAEGNVGVGGAVSVNVASAKTNAKIYSAATAPSITLGGGDFEVTATAENVHFGTKGDAEGKAEAASAGVGAGVAVAVTGADAVAAVQDGVKFTMADEDAALENIKVIAAQKVKDAIVGKAGGAGGVSVMPVLALDITGSGAIAYLGALTSDSDALSMGTKEELYRGEELKTAVVYASNEAEHTSTAKGSASSGTAAVAAAFNITILNDSAEAVLKHSVNANGIFVGADSVSNLKSISSAGAAGAEEEKDEEGENKEGAADEQADKAIAGGAGLASINGSNNVSAESILEKNSNRQKAETSEGGVSVAAGFVLNIQDNAAKATVDGNAALRAVRVPGVEENEDENAKIYEQDLNGTVRVLSRNRTIADVKADASASNGSVGVGVAVAINIVDIQNVARVGGGVSILADENVDVRAAVLIGEKEEEDEGSSGNGEVITPEDTRSALQIELENALKSALNTLMGKLGLSQYSDILSGGIASMIAQIAGAFTNEMLTKNTGIGDKLKRITSFNDISVILKDNIAVAEGVINKIPEMVKDSLNEILKAAVGEDTLELVKSLKDGSLMEELFDTNGLEKAPIEIINTTLNAIKDAKSAVDNTVTQLKNTIKAIQDTAKSLLDINIDINTTKLEEMADEFQTKDLVKQLIEQINTLKGYVKIDDLGLDELMDLSELTDMSALTDLSKLTEQLEKLEVIKDKLEHLADRLTGAVETVLNTDFPAMVRDAGNLGLQAITNLKNDVVSLILETVKDSITGFSINTDKFKEGVQEALTKTIKNLVEQTTAKAVAEVKGIYNEAVELVGTVKSVYDGTKEFVGDKVTAVQDKLKDLEKKLGQLEGLATALKNKATGIIDTSKELLKTVKQLPGALEHDVGVIGDETPGIANDVFEQIKTQVTDQVMGKLTDLADVIKANYDSSIGGFTTMVDNAKTSYFNIIQKGIDTFNDKKELITKTLEKAEKAYDHISETVLDGEKFKKAMEETIKKAVTDLKDQVVNSLTDGIVDIDQFTKYINGGTLATDLKDALIEGVKKSGLALTTTALDTLNELVDLSIKPVENNDHEKHLITTQAIAGAGGGDVGVAGSVAVAVLNGTTKAIIENYNGTSQTDITDDNGAVIGKKASIEAGGEVDIIAVNDQKVTTTASGALDADGEADKNEGAGETETEEAGSKEDSLALTVGNHEFMATSGGKVEKDGENEIKLTANNDGYNIPQKVSYSYTDKDGKQKTGEATVSGGTFTIPTISDLGDNEKVTWNVVFDPVLYGISTPSNVSVKVKDRDGAQAAYEDLVEVQVKNQDQDGNVLDKLTYTFNGEEKQIVVKDHSNSDETTYVFYMPKGAVSLKATYKDAPADAKTADTNSKGSSVGVGAAFSFNYGEVNTEAALGESRVVDADALAIRAKADRETETSAVSGTDPIDKNSPKGNKPADVSIDASVALNILDGSISASVGKNTTITTHGGDSIVIEETDEEAEDDNESAEGSEPQNGNETENVTGDDSPKANFLLTAEESGNAVTRASGFAMGQSTAVGAAVAINIISTGVDVDFKGDAHLEQGTAHIVGTSSSEDESNAIATAMGADMQRYIDKLHDTEATAEKIASGEYWNSSSSDSSDDKKDNKTADNINSKLDKNSDKEDGEKANSNAALSTNVLRTQNVGDKTSTNGANDDIKEAGTEANGATDQNLEMKNGSEGSSVQVAAAVGLTISKHKVNTSVSGKINAANGINILANNEGNFRTLGTGVAMSLASGSNSIAAAVGVSVNRNEANVNIAKDDNETNASNPEIISENGDVNVAANLTQNTTGKYNGLLATQSIAGSVSGDGGASVAGAVSVLVSSAATKAMIGDNAKVEAHKISLEAVDKSKMAIRAGGISVSKGASAGVGASVAVIVSNNEVEASIGDGSTLTGNRLNVLAEKTMVTMKDYKLPYGIERAVTNSTGVDDENAQTGILDMKKEGDSYKVNINITSDDLLAAVDLLNFLSSTNYYVEAIGGSVNTGAQSTASVAGSIALVYFNNKINAAIGAANITMTAGAGEDEDGSVSVNAYGGSNTRMIAGAVSASASNSVGADIGILINKDVVHSNVGVAKEGVTGHAVINAAGDYAQSAKVDSYTQIFSISASAGKKNTVGGTINVIVSNNEAVSKLGDNAEVTSGRKLDVLANTAEDMLLVSAAAAVALSNGAAVGGNADVIVNRAKTQAIVGAGAKLLAGTDLRIHAEDRERLISVIAAVSAAGEGTSVAGAAGVLVTKSETTVDIGNAAKLTATAGNLSLKAQSDSLMANAILSTSISLGGAGIGATVNVDVFKRDVKINTANADLTAGKNIASQALAKARSPWPLRTITSTIPTAVNSRQLRAAALPLNPITASR